MAGPRFLLVTGVTVPDRTRPGWRGTPSPVPGSEGCDGDQGSWVAWRLLGRNNRELGRSPHAYHRVPGCLDAIARLRRDTPDAARVLAVDPDDGKWLWRLEHLGVQLAVSARTYQRQRECLYSLTQFVAAVPDADLPALRMELPAPSSRSVEPPTGPPAVPPVEPPFRLRAAGGMAS